MTFNWTSPGYYEPAELLQVGMLVVKPGLLQLLTGPPPDGDLQAERTASSGL